jgi:hypothetical protein
VLTEAQVSLQVSLLQSLWSDIIQDRLVGKPVDELQSLLSVANETITKDNQEWYVFTEGSNEEGPCKTVVQIDCAKGIVLSSSMLCPEW